MKHIRVLIVDDSVVVRRMIRDALSADPAIEICGVAANGRIALSMIEQCSPDIMTLDIEMPEMDGLEVLRQLSRRRPAPAVVMFSTLTQRGAVATLDALALGARDYVTKPSNVGNVTAAVEVIRRELIPKLKALCGVPPVTSILPAPLPKSPYGTGAVRPSPGRPIEILAIGTSTGGPNALSQVLPLLPADFPVPVVVVQHMPPTFTRFLAQRLNNDCRIPVAEAEDNQALHAGKILIAPGDFHIAVEQHGAGVFLRTLHTPHENSCRPAVDVLFRSIASVYGPQALAVVMTGMGQDGLRGAQRLYETGATILVQDEESSVVWGMPGFIAQAGLATKVMALSQLGMEIIRRVRESHRIGWSAENGAYVHHAD